MTQTTAQFVSTSKISSYHAHIYFDEATLEQAKALGNTAGELFKLKVGRFHCKPVGPHPCWSCQLAFDRDRFAEIVAWLSLNRNGLDILLHPLTGDDLKDHTDHAGWLGNSQALNLAALT